YSPTLVCSRANGRPASDPKLSEPPVEFSFLLPPHGGSKCVRRAMVDLQVVRVAAGAWWGSRCFDSKNVHPEFPRPNQTIKLYSFGRNNPRRFLFCGFLQERPILL